MPFNTFITCTEYLVKTFITIKVKVDEQKDFIVKIILEPLKIERGYMRELRTTET